MLPVSADQQAQTYATLVSEFLEDPVEGWLYPAPPEYGTHFPKFLAVGEKAFEHETVWHSPGTAAYRTCVRRPGEVARLLDAAYSPGRLRLSVPSRRW